MSGPKSCRYSIRRLQREENARRRAQERKRREELLKNVREAHKRCENLEQQRQRLESLAADLQARFPAERLGLNFAFQKRPDVDDLEALEAYEKRLSAFLDEAKDQLDAAHNEAASNQQFRNALKIATDLLNSKTASSKDAIDAFVAAQASERIAVAKRERQGVLNRILARAPADQIPVELERLGANFLTAESEQRADAIASELRLRIQRLLTEDKERKRERVRAAELLDELEAVKSKEAASLKQRLELVMAGAYRFDAKTQEQVEGFIARAKRAMAGEIVHGALHDLGYEVSGIENTLFVEGGVAYFKRAEWDNYCVRLTARPSEDTMNFNVVRFGDEQRDHLSDKEIENAWCSEYGQLIGELKKRGMDATLTRQVAAGAVAIPRVGVGTVPSQFAARKGEPRRNTRVMAKSKGR